MRTISIFYCHYVETNSTRRKGSLSYEHNTNVANHFWGNCESLWSIDTQYFWVIANHFWPIANHLSLLMDSQKIFYGPHSFSREALCNMEQRCE